MENNLAVTISAIAAAISAATALISVIFSLKRSRRQYLDELKVAVLEFVADPVTFHKWKHSIDTYGFTTSHLIRLLGRKYRYSMKWYNLFPAAITELKNEGYHEELCISPTGRVFDRRTTTSTK